MKFKKIFKSYTFNISLIIILTGFVLWLILKDNYDNIMQLMSKVDYSLLLLTLFMIFCAQILSGYSLACFAKLSNTKYNIINGIANTLVANFVSGITPSSTGGQIAQIYAFRKQNIRMSDSISILWMDFIIGQTMICLVGSIIMIFKFIYFYNTHSKLFIISMLGLILNIIMILGLYLVTKYDKCYKFLTHTIFNIGCKFKMIKDKDSAKDRLDQSLVRFENEIIKLKSHKFLIFKCSIIHLIRLLIQYSIPFMCFLTLGYQMNLDLFINCFTLTVFVTLLNTFFPMPGATGGTEITFMLMFQTFFDLVGVQAGVLLWRFSTYYLLLIIGLIAFTYFKFKRDIREEV